MEYVGVSTERLKELLSTYIHNQEDLERIDLAFRYAYEMHMDQYRKSGELYIVHPVKVAEILAEYKTGPDTIISGLIHDLVEDTPATIEIVTEMFGNDVAAIVEGVTKISQYKFKSRKEAIAKTHQKLIIAMSQDIRVILVKLADRLHNMRTIEFVNPEKRIRICRETLEIYAPIAHRLGIYRLKAELEDLCFKQIDPSGYAQVSESLQETKEERDKHLNFLISNITEEIEKTPVKYKIKGRIKNIYSIYKKMVTKNKDFAEVYDLLALRIIVDSIEDCYRVLGIIHAKYKPVPKRFKDYIAIPKVNMYQSLHTTIMTSNGIFEIQIRTQEMDDIAENGVAAHWAYKEGRSMANEQSEIRQSLSWYNDLFQMTTESDEINTEEFVNSIKEDLTANVFIFTPVGDVYMLPQGSTPVDFAYRIHTEVGHSCVGAIVNNKMVPIDYILKSNEIVEIKTSKTSKGPNEDWLKFCKTSSAKSKIRTFINNRDHDILLEDGKRKFEEIIKEYTEVIKITDDLVEKMFDVPEVKTIDDMYYNIGKNVYSARSAYNKLLGKKEITSEQILDQINQRNSNAPKANNAHGIVVEGLPNPLIKLSNCCHPIPGDNIVGYVSKGLGIAVHRDVCPNLKDVNKDRLLNVYWSLANNKLRYRVNLKVISIKRMQILSDIVAILSSNNANIHKYQSYDIDNDTQEIKMSIETYNVESLDKIMANIKKVRNILSIERTVN